jgi:hypothetical protein
MHRPEPLAAFLAFMAEHERCGELEGGRDHRYVWLQCSCGGLVIHPVERAAKDGRRDLTRIRQPSASISIGRVR